MLQRFELALMAFVVAYTLQSLDEYIEAETSDAVSDKVFYEISGTRDEESQYYSTNLVGSDYGIIIVPC